MGIVLMKKLIFISILYMLLIPLILAVPPITTIQTFTAGYEIRIPQDNILKVGEPYNFYVHVYNISNGYPITSGIGCYFHLYNSTGSHQLELYTSSVSHNFDYEFSLSKGNFTIIDRYYYDIQCNSSMYGGFHSSILEVNYLGKMIEEGRSTMYILFFGILILVFFLNFYGMSFLPARNQRDEEGKIMSISYLKYFRNVLWMTGYFLFIGIMYISSSLAFSFLEEELMAKTLFMIYRVSFLLAPVVIVVWIIWIFASMFHDKEFQNMLNRGIFPQGKL